MRCTSKFSVKTTPEYDVVIGDKKRKELERVHITVDVPEKILHEWKNSYSMC